MDIGDINLPLPLAENFAQDREVDTYRGLGDDTYRIREFETNLENGEIPFVLHQGTHPDNLSLEEQREAAMALLDREPTECPFDFLTEQGHLAVESVSVPRTSEANRREGSITVRYMPDALYAPAISTDEEQVDNNLGMDFYGIIPLSSIVENVRQYSPKTGDSISLSPVADPYTGDDGDIEYYTTTALLNVLEADSISGPNERVSDQAYGFEYLGFTASSDSLSHTFTIPDGEYEIYARVWDDTSDDTIDINGTTIDPPGEAAWNVEKVEDTAIDSQLTVTIDNLSGTNMFIDYVFLRPKVTPHIIFDYPSTSYVDGLRNGAISVYDTNNSSNESDWDRVYDGQHIFDSGIAVDNGNIRLFISDNLNEIRWYSWNTSSSSWSYIGKMSCYDGTSYFEDWKRFRVNELSTQIFEVEVDQIHSNGTFPATFRLEAGSMHGSMTVDFTEAPWKYFGTTGTSQDRGLASNGDIFHIETGVPSGGGTPSTAGHGASGTGINYALSWDNLGTDRIHYMTTNTSDSALGFQSSQMGFMSNADTVQQEATINFGTLPVLEVDNLFQEGEGMSSDTGVYENHWEMPLGVSGNLNEFTGDTASFTEDTTNNLLAHGSGGWDSIFLNTLEWGTSQSSNHYHWTFTPNETDNERADLAYSSQNATTQTDQYSVRVEADTSTVKLIHWDSSGNASQFSSVSFSFTGGTTYHVETEWDPANGAHDAYVWADGNGKPSSATISGTESSLSSGRVGWEVIGNWDLNSFSVDAEESVSSNLSTMIAQGWTGNSNTDTSFGYNPIENSLPFGSYFLVGRIKTTDSNNHNADIFAWNSTEGQKLDVSSETIEPSESYTYEIQLIRIDETHEGDNVEFYVRQNNSNTAEHLIIDSAFIIPATLLTGGSKLGPQDIGFQAMVDPNTERELLQRRYL